MTMARDATTINRKAAGGKIDGLRTGAASAFPVVVRVRTAVVVAPVGVIELGVTVQVASAGAPEHVSAIVWL